MEQPVNALINVFLNPEYSILHVIIIVCMKVIPSEEYWHKIINICSIQQVCLPAVSLWYAFSTHFTY